MLAVGLFVLLLLAGVGVLLFHGVAVLLAFQMPSLAPPATSVDPVGRRVSVVIAARNEELDLPACLDSVLAQEGVELEVVVVDGGSTDGTAAVARARAPRVTLLEEPPLPPDWVGKNWACQYGADRTLGEFLLFLDADVRLTPTALRQAVGWAERDRADMVSLAPRLEAVGFWERVVLPLMGQLILTYFRTPRVNRPGSRTAMANGQFLLIRRSAYDALGGHAAIRGAVLEDVRLAQRLRASGRPMRVGWAPELATTRMYRDRREMYEGLLKNVHGTEYSTARQLLFLAGLIGFYYLPLGLLPFALVVGSPVLAAFGALLIVAIFAKHVGFARSLTGHPAYGLLYPFAVAFYLALLLSSIRHGLAHRPIAWKGREYGRPGAAAGKR